MKQVYRLYGISTYINYTPIRLALSLLLFTLITTTGFAQVNAYAKVTAINTVSGQSVLTTTNRNQTYHTFAVGDQVIVIQMQDNVIGGNTGNNASFGNLSNINNAGFYEVGTINALTETTITLTGILTNTFTIGSNSSVQVVSFRELSTGNFTTTTNITAVPWNGTTGTGGVVAIQVPGTFTISHSINTDGQGFAGGAISNNYENQCTPGTYRTNSANYGGKGEGIYRATSTTYSRGRAKLLNGGGGGNDDNAGGAGGGNFTAGGNGGPGWTCTGANAAGGLGGIALNNYLMSGTRLFMGGGGGGGQGNNGTQTPGANGGGIVIIKAHTITTSCTSGTVRISANGNSSGSTTGGGYDGAGGGGAGGTILIHANAWSVPASCPLLIQANGGAGGNVTHNDAHGGGGGGGQGAVLLSGALPSSNTTTTTNPGLGGLNSTPGTVRAGSGEGTPDAGVIGGIGSVLPVHLIYLAAENQNKKAVIRWAATSDSKVTFNVQHSTDGIAFTTIGKVYGTANGNAAGNYSFTHHHAVTGKNYYRLEMISEAPAKTDYSTIVSVNMEQVQTVQMAWPNPAHDHFSIRVNQNISKSHVVTISDLTGKVIYTNNYKPANGIITVTPGKPLKPGIYMYKVTGEGPEQTGKLIIQ